VAQVAIGAPIEIAGRNVVTAMAQQGDHVGCLDVNYADGPSRLLRRIEVICL